MAVAQAAREGVANFWLLVGHPGTPAVKAILSIPNPPRELVAAGHVCAVEGTTGI